MKTQIIAATMTILATAALTAKRFCTSAGAVPAAGAWCPGVVEADTDAGQLAPVNTHGILLVEAGAAIAQDAQVQTDASGRAITLAAGVALGRVLDAAAAAGNVIRVKVS
ncbi:DUF2190 domain-containing protein [Rubrivivax gelatinosus]|uniref:DUF2190 family protein n=1 Tax=Rubrivivax gelatinosus TaxID=28068 RepID=UPI0019036087|nr:DUF2190 family protein [Rubrivivax gelatinosus]MBK1613364.1 DUF2190 domain-containing protein [Rubrivivax gelatinosus]MBZ8143076.1 DUF2190 domain-containing protein [Rubrivivax gelatinosus]